MIVGKSISLILFVTKKCAAHTVKERHPLLEHAANKRLRAHHQRIVTTPAVIQHRDDPAGDKQANH